MKKPTFFISSTIYDFKDLRSALKFYLEQQGCTVFASEYPDFKVDLDKHTYQACLDAIAASDYFVLLIGARVGGWYDKAGRISITQQEYREAYKLSRSGRLKIISFVRSEIWEHRENRNELVKYLRSTELPVSMQSEIGGHPSKICADSNFIIGFIAEVSRNAETKRALEDPGALFPAGNWIYVFSGFREIVDAVQSQIISDKPLEEAGMKRLLENELRTNLKALLWRSEDELYSPEITINNFYVEHIVTKDVMKSETFVVDAKRWDLLSSWSIHLLGVRVIDRVLDHCLRSALFLEFDALKGVVTRSGVIVLLEQLSDEISRFREACSTETLQVVYDFSRAKGYSRDRPVPVSTTKLMALLHLFYRWINIVKISAAIANHLQGGPLVVPSLFRRSPIPDMNEELEKETPTEAQLDKFLARFGLAGD